MWMGVNRMVCLIEYLYWKSTGKEYKCERESCRFYGCDTCHAKEEEDDYLWISRNREKHDGEIF